MWVLLVPRICIIAHPSCVLEQRKNSSAIALFVWRARWQVSIAPSRCPPRALLLSQSCVRSLRRGLALSVCSRASCSGRSRLGPRVVCCVDAADRSVTVSPRVLLPLLSESSARQLNHAAQRCCPSNRPSTHGPLRFADGSADVDLLQQRSPSSLSHRRPSSRSSRSRARTMLPSSPRRLEVRQCTNSNQQSSKSENQQQD